MKAIVYCRVSSQVQKDEGTSLDSQAAACKIFAEAKGYEVAEVIQEVFSGAYLRDRPLLSNIRDQIRQGKCQALVIYAIDRLSRKVEHLAILTDELDTYDAKLLCVTEDFDNSADGNLIRHIKAYTGEIERQKTGERTSRGRRTKAESGRFVNKHAPYGYRYNPDTGCRDIVEAEAEVVRLIFQLYLAGMSTSGVQKHLNRNKIASPGNGYWGSAGVQRMLKNETYIGRSYAFRYQKITDRIKGKRRVSATLRDRTGWITLPDGLTPAIITKQEFDAVQHLMDKNKRTLRRATYGMYLMRQRIVCGVCGRNMRAESRPGNLKYYRCVPHVVELRCENNSVNGNEVEQVIWQKVSEVIQSPRAVTRIREKHLKNVMSRDAIQARAQRAIKQLAKAQRELDLLSERAGEVSAAAWESLKKQIDLKGAAVDTLKAERLATERALLDYDQLTVDFLPLESYIESVRVKLTTLEYPDRLRVIEALDVRASWDRGKLHITMSVIPDYYCGKLELVSGNSNRVDLT